MGKYRAPRGVSDIFPEDQKHWRFFAAIGSDLCHQYGYKRIDTPVFEDTRLFVRSVGQATDIVEKEMYTFMDRGDDSLTLRPEGTAPICRAYLQHGMANLPQPVRLYYFAPMFRYDRPQAGRFRQFHQFGIEAIGDPDPILDAEVIGMAWGFMDAAGLDLSKLTLSINSIGDMICRPHYAGELATYYSDRIKSLCANCRRRLNDSPLRLLDCKEATCKELAQEAPRSVDHLCGPCRGHWEKLLKYLRAMQIPYRVDSSLVRGLDYYTRTVFEIQSLQDRAQNTLCAGGRYDGLMEELGGKSTPGVGFAAGLERVILMPRHCDIPNIDSRPVVVVCLNDVEYEDGLLLAGRLRKWGIPTVLSPIGRSLKGQMRYARAMEALAVVFCGGTEWARGSVVVRDMDARKQHEVHLTELEEQLRVFSD